MEHFAGWSIYMIMDHFVRYDHWALTDKLCDLITFQTPLETFCLTVLPQGWTDSLAVFQNNMAFILQHEIYLTSNFQGDINVFEPWAHYEQLDGSYKIIPGNPIIHWFIWEHCLDLNWVLHHLKHAGAMVSAKKLFVCQPEIIVVGQVSNYTSHTLNDMKVSKIQHWPTCQLKTEVHSFFRLTRIICTWVKDFVSIAWPLVQLMRANVPIIWIADYQ